MNGIKEEITFGANHKKSSSVLTKAIIGSALVIGILFTAPSFYSYVKQKIELNQLKKFDRYEVTGGHIYQGAITALNYVSAEDKTVVNIELDSSDTFLYLNHPGVSPTKVRSLSQVLELNRFFDEIIQKDVRYVEVTVTTYENKFKKDRFHLIMTAKEIPPIERTIDMDSERTIFRHPDTFEVITKEFWEELMKERKDFENFKSAVAQSLEEKPEKFSKYTLPFLNGWTKNQVEEKPVLVDGKCVSSPSLSGKIKIVPKEKTKEELFLRDKYTYEYMISGIIVENKETLISKLDKNHHNNIEIKSAKKNKKIKHFS